MTTTTAIRIANDSLFCESRQSVKKLEDDLINDEAMNAPLHEIERMMRTAGRELMREMMQAHFDRRSAQERAVEVRDVDDVERVRIREGRRTVMTEFGEVDRKLYQATGADALAPLDAAMELSTRLAAHERAGPVDVRGLEKLSLVG